MDVSRVALSFLLIGLNACTVTPTRQVASPQAAAEPPAPPAEPVNLEAVGPGSAPLGPDDDAPTTEADPPPRRSAEPAYAQPERPPHPLDGIADEALETMLLEDPATLGPMSIGRTNAGALFNAVAMPEGPLWKIVNPRQTWGTQETVDALARCIERVADEFPETPPIYIGDISEKSGGQIDRHLSHQSGRDVDLGFYYTEPVRWYTRAHAGNLDLPRTWAFIKALVIETDVERIFIDHAIQPLLREHALAAGEDPAWVDRIFGGETTDERPLILHEPGHDTHIHVRFYNPVAQETGRRLYKLLIAHKKVSPPVYYVHHKVKRGDTLIKMARRYGTSVSTIKRANGLRSNTIYAGRSYKIPRRGGVIPTTAALTIPPRRLPDHGNGSPPSAVASPER
jgi:murein endopeptidase